MIRTLVASLLLVLLGLSSSSGLRLDQTKQVNGTKWAVLVAGSSGWYNYRHQADICHAYHVLKAHGISEDNIITFMYDDIANHPENPFPGQVFNDYRHVNYYEGVKIDYRLENVTVKNFMDALVGSPELKAKGLKVLESGPNDEVFIYFTDHGGSGIICFPDISMTASQLNDTFTKMHARHMYRNLVFYLEACESGSMFNDIISPHINVFATTAANGEESSWASFCEDKNLSTCLADEYSHNWMQDTETHNTHKRTLQQQFRGIKNKTKKSHVQEYGDLHLASLPVGEFQGESSDPESIESNTPLDNVDLIPSRYTQIRMLLKRLESNHETEASHLYRRRLERVLQLNKMVMETAEDIEFIVRKGNPNRTVQTIYDWLPCYESVQKKYMDLCFRMQQVPIVAEILPRLVKLCKDGYEKQTIENAILLTCE